MTARVLFTGHAHSHVVCFRPLYEYLRARGDVHVFVSGGLPVSDELTGRMEALRAHLERLPEFGLPGLRRVGAGPRDVASGCALTLGPDTTDID